MKTLFGILALVILSGCGGGIGPRQTPILPPQGLPGAPPLRSYIKHIVIIVQENRSFDDIFYGFKGADYATYGYTSSGKKVALTPRTFGGSDLTHDWNAAIASWDNGKMDGFNHEQTQPPSGPPARLSMYSYLDRKLVAPYWDLAKRYVLADHMFPTMFGETFTAHLDLIAATASIKSDLSLVNCRARPTHRGVAMPPKAQSRAS